eukprot:jgi/Hompol1/4838/HPOL_003992-RA
MDNVHQPKAKGLQPQGEPRSAAWDQEDFASSLPPKEVNRSSSAPPTQLMLSDYGVKLEIRSSPTLIG